MTKLDDAIRKVLYTTGDYRTEDKEEDFIIKEIEGACMSFFQHKSRIKSEEKTLKKLLTNSEKENDDDILMFNKVDDLTYEGIKRLINRAALSSKALKEIKQKVQNRDYGKMDGRKIEQRLNYLIRKKEQEETVKVFTAKTNN